MIYPTDLPPSECFLLGDDESITWLQITNRQTLVSIFKNGCRPRYSCLALNKVAPSVIQYRLSQSTVWPHSDNIRPQDICAARTFADDMPPLGATYRNHYEKFLVRNDNREYVPCNVEENIGFNAIFNGSPEDKCVGELKSCASDNTTLILHFSSCQNQNQLGVLRCLSSLTQTRTQFLLLEAQGEPENILCMVWSTERKMSRIYFLHVSDCNVDVLNTIKHGYFSMYIAEFQPVFLYNSSTDCLEADNSLASPVSSPFPSSRTTDALTSEMSPTFTTKTIAIESETMTGDSETMTSDSETMASESLTMTSDSEIVTNRNKDLTRSYQDRTYERSTLENSVAPEQTKGSTFEASYSPFSGQSTLTWRENRFEIDQTNGPSKNKDIAETSTMIINKVTTDVLDNLSDFTDSHNVASDTLVTNTHAVVTKIDRDVTDSQHVTTNNVVKAHGGKVKSKATQSIGFKMGLFCLIAFQFIF